MFFLVEYNDDSYDILQVEDAKLKNADKGIVKPTSEDDIDVGDLVKIAFKTRAKKRNNIVNHDGRIVEKSENKEYLENYMADLKDINQYPLATAEVETPKNKVNENTPTSLGRGQRVIKRTRLFADDEETEETINRKTSPAKKAKKSPRKAQKQLEELLLNEIREETKKKETNKEVEELKKKNELLTAEIDRLRKERNNAQDVSKYLKEAKEILKIVQDIHKSDGTKVSEKAKESSDEESNHDNTRYGVQQVHKSDFHYGTKVSQKFKEKFVEEPNHDNIHYGVQEVHTSNFHYGTKVSQKLNEKVVAEPNHDGGDHDVNADEIYLHKKGDKNVEELVEGASGVYIKSYSKSVIPIDAKNPSTLTRTVMRAVLTPNAMKTLCAVGAHGKKGLPTEALEAFIEFVRTVCKDKKWPEYNMKKEFFTRLINQAFMDARKK